MQKFLVAIACFSALVSIGSILVLQWNSHDNFNNAILLNLNDDPYHDDVWEASSLGSPTDPEMLSSSKTSGSGPHSASGKRGRDGSNDSPDGISARAIGHEKHNYAETFIDKHIYPPWPGYTDRARNTVDEDKITEGELAARLSRAIDRHEKCRRHWPHLERLETAQEIRVRDARNNLEVANRGIERARKELIDAENLVMAARQVSTVCVFCFLPCFHVELFDMPFFRSIKCMSRREATFQQSGSNTPLNILT
jgi:hypothetical protein